MEILEKHGIDAVGPVTMDESAEVSSLVDQHDLADGVAQLAEKLFIAQSHVSSKEQMKSLKVKELEEKITSSAAEYEDFKATKLALEKRVETMKTAARTSREEIVTLTLQLENLNNIINELKTELQEAKSKVSSSSESVSSEIQVLEEENIELMKENKELRIEISRLKITTSSTINTLVENTINEDNISSSVSTIGVKRSFGTEINVSSEQQKTNRNPLEPTVTQCVNTKSVDVVASLDGAENANSCKKNRRVRSKAKALVDDVDLTAKVAVGSDEKNGECAQS